MSAYPELTKQVEVSEEGPEIGAFFDLDRTLIQGFSALSFVLDGVRNGQYGASELFELLVAATGFELGTIDFSSFLTGSAQVLRGAKEEDVRAMGERIFRDSIASRIHPEARASFPASSGACRSHHPAWAAAAA